jgi:hypothetical protein
VKRNLLNRSKHDKLLFESAEKIDAVDTENSVRIKNAGFRSIREINAVSNLARVTLLLRSLAR